MVGGPPSPPVWSAACPLLACPACREPLVSAAAGGLACRRCRRAYPVRDGVPALLPPEDAGGASRRTVAAFDRQWRAYGGLRRLFGKDASQMARNLAGPRLSRRIDPDWYRGRRVLDAGCGHGRYLRAFAEAGAEVVGLDAGALRTARRIAAGHARIVLVRGSVLSLPFRAGSFDLVFCDGVLHHTPDPAAAYAELARVARPGGAVYVWVYPREGRLREAVFGALRLVTTRLPGTLVRALAWALAPLTLGVRSYSGTRFGRATWAECAQVVHDWIAPPIQSHHTAQEVEGWARAAGLVDAEHLPVPVGLTAWKPAAGGAPPPEP